LAFQNFSGFQSNRWSLQDLQYRWLQVISIEPQVISAEPREHFKFFSWLLRIFRFSGEPLVIAVDQSYDANSFDARPTRTWTQKSRRKIIFGILRVECVESVQIWLEV